MSFELDDFDPIDFEFLGPSTDIILEIMIILKEKWNLTGDLTGSNIAFGTRFYDKNILFPQVIVKPLGGDESPPIDMGSSEATYPDRQSIGVDIWVRPKQDSNTSIGWAKNAIYQIRKEVERILKSGSRLNNYQDDRILHLGGWRRRDDLRSRPPIFHLEGQSYVVKYVKGI